MNVNVSQKGTVVILGQVILSGAGAVLCIEGCLAAFLGSVYEMLVVSLLHVTIPLLCKEQKCLQIVSNVLE